MSRAAVFLDRDGTLIEDVGYLREPAAVRLLPGAAAAVVRLERAGFLIVVVTNQSGIARGLLSEADYRAAEARVDQLLASAGARVDGHYFCPHLPSLTGPCDCRKPGVGLYRRAAAELGIDLAASWWVGDRLRDVLPAQPLGGRSILLVGGDRGEGSGAGVLHAADLAAAAAFLAAQPAPASS